MPADDVDEVRQETVRIVNRTGRLLNHLIKAERQAVRIVWCNVDLKLLPADKGNETVILSAEPRPATSPLHPAHRRLDEELTEAVQRKTSDLIRRSSLTEEIAKLV